MHSFISSCVLLAAARFVLSLPIVQVDPTVGPVDINNALGVVNILPVIAPVTGILSATGLDDLTEGLAKRQVEEVENLVSGVESLPGLATAEGLVDGLPIEDLVNLGNLERSLPNLNAILGNSQVSVDSVAEQIESMIQNSPAGSTVMPMLEQLNNILTSASDQIGQLTGLPITDMVEDIESTPLGAQQAAQTLAAISNKVTSTVSSVEGAAGSSAPEVQPMIDSINNSASSLFTTFNSLDSTLSSIAAPILAQVTPIASTLGLPSLPFIGSL